MRLFRGFVFRIMFTYVATFPDNQPRSQYYAQLILRRNKRTLRVSKELHPITTMDLFFEHLVRTLIFFLLTFSLCNANIQSVATIFTEKKIVATSHTTLQKISKIKCVDTCNKERQKGMCNLAGYNKATQTCYLSVDDPQSALDTPDEMSGIFFYEYGPTGIYCMILLKCDMAFIG